MRSYNEETKAKLRQYFLSKHQPEWLEQHGFDRLSLKDLLSVPEVRQEAFGFARGFVQEIISKADQEESDRRGLIQEANRRDKLYWGDYLPTDTPTEFVTFDSFQHRSGFPRVEEALTTTMEWVAQLGRETLTLSGPPGVGKTHLAKAALCRLLERGRPVCYRTEAALVQEVHRGIRAGTVDNIIEEACQTPQLILDDLGAVALGEWDKGIRDQIIDARWGARLWTLITTNLLGEDLPPRVASRLRDVSRCRSITIVASDYRLEER